MANKKAKPILIADDLATDDQGRQRADAVRSCIVAMSKKLGSPIQLVHVEKDIRWGSIFTASSAAMINESKKEKEAELKSIAQNLGVPTKTTFLKGEPVEQLLKLTSRVGSYELLAMGTQGLKGLGRMLIGSVSEEVIRNARVPVLTINDECAKQIHGFLDQAPTILVASSLTKNSDKAEKYAAILAKRLDASVVLFHNLFDSLHPMMQAGLKSSRAAEFKDAVEKIKKYSLKQLELRAKKFKTLKINVSIVLDDVEQSAPESVLRGIQQTSSDLVIMGTHGRSLVTGTFFGRTARGVILDATIPVITVHSHRT